MQSDLLIIKCNVRVQKHLQQTNRKFNKNSNFNITGKSTNNKTYISSRNVWRHLCITF